VRHDFSSKIWCTHSAYISHPFTPAGHSRLFNTQCMVFSASGVARMARVPSNPAFPGQGAAFMKAMKVPLLFNTCWCPLACRHFQEATDIYKRLLLENREFLALNVWVRGLREWYRIYLVLCFIAMPLESHYDPWWSAFWITLWFLIAVPFGITWWCLMAVFWLCASWRATLWQGFVVLCRHKIRAIAWHPEEVMPDPSSCSAYHAWLLGLQVNNGSLGTCEQTQKAQIPTLLMPSQL